VVLDAMFGQLKSVVDGWQGEATRRRQISTIDPVADALEHCASELADQVAALLNDTYYLTVEDYARLNGVVPGTVRAWIKRGELTAIATERGWKIRRDEKRRKRA
jgi:excisionase family DNA binding protein